MSEPPLHRIDEDARVGDPLSIQYALQPAPAPPTEPDAPLLGTPISTLTGEGEIYVHTDTIMTPVPSPLPAQNTTKRRRLNIFGSKAKCRKVDGAIEYEGIQNTISSTAAAHTVNPHTHSSDGAQATEPSTSGATIPPRTLEEQVKMVTVSEDARSREKADHDDLMEWIGTRRAVLDGLKGIASGNTLLAPFRALFGLTDSVLKLMESVETSDKKWNGTRDAIQRHLMYVKNEIEGNEDTERVAPDSPRMKFLREYAGELGKVFETYLVDRGITKDELTGKQPPKVMEYIKDVGRFFKKSGRATLELEKITGLRDRLTESLQNYERNKTTYIADATYQLLHANIDRLLRPVRSDAQQPEANGRQHTKCHAETRMIILSDIRQWASSAEAPSLCLLIDAAGLGKSTMAYTLAQERRDTKSYLGASFFFSRGNAGTSTPLDFMRHVSWSLMQSYPQVKHHPSMSYDEINKALDSHSLEDQWERLVSTPLSILVDEARMTDRQIVLIIDALDECSENQREEFIRLLSTLPNGHTRLFITSRPEHDVETLLGDPRTVQQCSLDHQNSNLVDLGVYVKHRFSSMRMGVDEAEKLSKYSGGLFILAATVCDLLQRSDTKKRLLNSIIEDGGKTANQRLESLYMGILRLQLDRDVYSKDAIQNIFRIILVASRSLTIGEIKALCPFKEELDITAIIMRFSSVLRCGTDDGTPVYVRHPTFREFMLNPKISGAYGVTFESAHHFLASCCLSIMVDHLQQNLCHIDANMSFEEPRSLLDLALQLQVNVDSAVLYAASNWTFHAAEGWIGGSMEIQVQRFFETKLLNWIELGVIGGLLPEFMRGIHQLELVAESVAAKSNAKSNSQWCNDILEFMRQNQTMLSHFPLQVYSSALTFTPCQSQIYQVYAHTSLPKIVVGHPARTSGTLVLMGHRASVNAVTYSSGGELLVSAADDGEIVVWDARTGARQWDYKLKGKERRCIGVRVLPGNRVIVLLSYDPLRGQKYTRLYRLSCETKGLLFPAEKLDIYSVCSCISWAPDLNGFACGTEDGAVHLFTLGGQLQRISSINTHEGSVARLSLSHDGITMASTSWFETIKIWSLTPEGLTGPTAVWKHSKGVRDGAFSPVDSSLFTFVDGDSLHLYNISTNTIDFSFYYRDYAPHAMVYSHDGKQIAVRGMHEHSIHIINTVDMDKNNTPMTREIHAGHTGFIYCLAFSSDDRYLVTGSSDASLRIHDLTITAPQTTATGHRYTVSSLSFSFDGRWLASVDDEGNIYTWNVENGNLIQDAVQTGIQFPQVAMSSDRSVVACAIFTTDIRFSSRNQIGPKLSLRYSKVVDVVAMVFSPDDTKLAMTTREMTTRENQIVLIDMQITHALSIQPFIMVKLDFDPRGMLLAFHPSGDYICCADHAWGVTNSNLNSLTGDQLGTILKETFPLLRFDRRASPSPSISLSSLTRQVFYIPPDFKVYSHTIHDGNIALGAQDGRIMVIDFTHLATEEEQVLLDHINTMRRETAARSGPSRLHEILSSYSGPRKLVIRVDHSETRGDFDPESSEGGGDEDEDEDGEDGEEG